MKRKFIITAEMRDLEKQVNLAEISYGRMIEILCEKADEYAEEYHQSELLKLNKSDISGSVADYVGRNCPFCGEPCVECSHKATDR